MNEYRFSLDTFFVVIVDLFIYTEHTTLILLLLHATSILLLLPQCYDYVARERERELLDSLFLLLFKHYLNLLVVDFILNIMMILVTNFIFEANWLLFFCVSKWALFFHCYTVVHGVYYTHRIVFPVFKLLISFIPNKRNRKFLS